MPLPAPFGKYELLERIATGGMAEVYLARSSGVAGFQKRLVIKRLRPELEEDPRFVQMFVNEARIGVHLNHPNIVSVYELGRVGNAHFMAMEHLHGRDLTRVVKALRAHGERIGIPVVVAIVAEVCRGLAYAHSRTAADGTPLGLVHRDISPHNLLVTFAGEVKLVDFGIARLKNAATSDEPAKPGPGGGKYAYMSPEQAEGGELDHRSDIFSAGIVLWELIVGERLYQDPDPAEKLRRVREAAVEDPRDRGAPIDDALWEILQRALARDPEDRYESAALFDEDLRAWLFRHRFQVGRAEVAALVRAAFPEEARTSHDDLGLQQLLADIDRLGGREPLGEEVAAPPSPDLDPDLPGRLRAASGERRQVVVVMIDVDGLTELSARVTPEMLVKRKYQLLRWMRRIVDRYGGLVQRAIDDHVTILFGVPRSRVDDVSHALECALHLHRDVSQLRRKGMALELAIGVHSGEVTVQPSRRRVRYVARGDTTRLARRLSAVADHGQTLVSERVLAMVEGEFRLRRGPRVASRGGRASLDAYLVEGRSHGLRGAHRGPWLRRDREVEILRNALAELAAGHGAAVAVIGEVGSGKSRLIREIRDLADRRGILFIGARVPATRERPLEPLRDLTAAVLGIDPENPHDQLQDVLDRLGQLGLRPRDVEAVQSLLGSSPRHSPERAETWSALGRILRGVAEDRPAIVALDEAHHLYQGGSEDLSGLIRSVADVPILLLLSSRPPLDPALSGVTTEVRLPPLTAPLQERLVGRILDAHTIDPELLELLQRTCEGNPLYLEEMLKYLVASGRVTVSEDRAHLAEVQNVEAELPHTLQALITSRIDALDPAARGLLQLAAVAGSEFTLPLLAEAAGLDPTPLVLDLFAHGLVVREGDEWAFASELVREAALRGTLGVQRRDYHRLVAAALEKLHEGRLEPHLEALMNHCAEGGRPIDAARYAYRAGIELEKKAFFERAMICYSTGLERLARADRNPDEWDARVQGEAMLNIRLGYVNLMLGDFDRGRYRMQLALEIASEAGLPWIEARAHVELGRSYLQERRLDLADAHLSQARALLEIEDDPELEMEALEASAGLAFDRGSHAEAEALWERAIELADDDLVAVARCEIGLANRHLRMGDYGRAARLLERALVTARGAGDRILEGRVLNNIGLLRAWTGELEEALRYYRAALEVREGVGYTRGVVVNHHNIGDVHFQTGDYARAWVAFSRSRELASQIGWERGVVLNDVYLAYLDADAGRADVAPLLEATERAGRLGDPEVSTSGAWLAGRWLMAHGREEEATAQLESALQDARRLGLQPMVELIEEALARAAGSSA